MEEYQSIFKKLKSIRQENKISLEIISEKTKIRISFLEAIENGEIEKIPSVYDMLFFKSYLDSIKVENPEYYLDIFKQYRKEIEGSDPTTLTSVKIAKSEKNLYYKKRALLVGLPVILAVMIIIIMALNSKKIETGDSQNIKELRVMEIVDELEARHQAVQDSIDSIRISKQEIVPGVSVGLKAREETWVRYVKDFKDTSEILLKVGQSVAVSADSILEFLVGKANGLEFSINGTDVGILGNEGEVITNLTVTQNGIQQKRIKKTTL